MKRKQHKLKVRRLSAKRRELYRALWVTAALMSESPDSTPPKHWLRLGKMPLPTCAVVYHFSQLVYEEDPEYFNYIVRREQILTPFPTQHPAPRTKATARAQGWVYIGVLIARRAKILSSTYEVLPRDDD